jgi:hypothetical protein
VEFRRRDGNYSMRLILWRGKIGYGDIVSPICYAYNESVRRDEDVELVFLYNNLRKYKSEDSETQLERIRFIDKNTNTSDITRSVDILAEVNTLMPDNFQHTNYTDNPVDLHNLRFSSKYFWNGSGDHICFITPEKNREPVVPWKNPENGYWYKNPEKWGYPVETIHYETPIKEICETLQTAKFVFTYHGSAAWLCKWIGCPMAVFSERPRWSQKVFPWAVANDTGSFKHSVETMQEWSIKERVAVRKRLQRYLQCVE